MQTSPLPAAPIIAAPTYKLYDPRATTIATFLGTPLAGSIIMAMNYKRVGKASSAVWAIVLGVLATAVIIAIAFVVPENTPRPVLWIPQIIIMGAVAKALQGKDFDQHKLAGGAVASMWGAVGIGLAVLAVAVGIWAMVYLNSRPPGTRLAIGKDEVYYSGTATAADAQALGDVLKEVGFLADRGVTVLLSKGTEGTIVSFVISEEGLKTPGLQEQFELVARAIAPKIGGLPLTVRLVDGKLVKQQEFVVKPLAAKSGTGRS